jgi:hypothetical protein
MNGMGNRPALPPLHPFVFAAISLRIYRRTD